MHSEKNSTEKVFWGVNFGLHTITKITSIAQSKPMEENSTEKLLYFNLLTFGEVQKDVGSAV